MEVELPLRGCSITNVPTPPLEVWDQISRLLVKRDWESWRCACRTFWDLTLHDPYPYTNIYKVGEYFFSSLRRASVYFLLNFPEVQKVFPYYSIWDVDPTSSLYEEIVEAVEQLNALGEFPKWARYTFTRLSSFGEIEGSEIYYSSHLNAVSATIHPLIRGTIARDLRQYTRSHDFGSAYLNSRQLSNRISLIEKYITLLVPEDRKISTEEIVEHLIDELSYIPEEDLEKLWEEYHPFLWFSNATITKVTIRE